MNEPLLQFFEDGYLRRFSQPEIDVAEPFSVLARDIAETVPRNAERTLALRKLIEARDAAMRAVWTAMEAGQ